jgi:hypothetical protein
LKAVEGNRLWGEIVKFPDTITLGDNET